MSIRKALKPVLIVTGLMIMFSMACKAVTQPTITATVVPAVAEATKPPGNRSFTQPPKPPQPSAAPQANKAPEPTAVPTAVLLGMGRSNPYSISEVAVAPNWDVRVLEVKRGQPAWEDIQAANMFNRPAPDGKEYLLIKVRVKSTHPDSEEHAISGCDIVLTGDRLIRYDCSMENIITPDPSLMANLTSGAETEGWIAFLIGQAEGNLMLALDSSFGVDPGAVRFIALDAGAKFEISDDLAGIKPTNLGRQRTNPAALQEPVTTDEWQITLLKQIRGEEAWEMVRAANQFNDPPAAGMEYIAVRLHVRYIGSQEMAANIDEGAFRATGANNVLYANPMVVNPEPTLDIDLYPGGEYEGWIVVQAANGESNMLLYFNPMYSFDRESIRYLALDAGASVEMAPELQEITPTNLGSEKESPAGLGEKVTNSEWEMAVQEIRRGEAAWTLVEAANEYNEPPEAGMEYVAVRIRVRNIYLEDAAAFLSKYNFRSMGNAGVIYDPPSVVGPEPDLDVHLFPGGEGEGWIVVQVGLNENGLILIFEPTFGITEENNRYFSLEP